MKKLLLVAACAFALTAPSFGQTEAPEEAEVAPSPNEIVNSAPQEEWIAIAAEDLLVMTLAPDARGNEREVVIQLMPAPFSQGWVENIRTLARAQWYDGISVNRVQDNYVVQWGDPGHDNPESGDVETKPLPEGLNVMDEADYEIDSLCCQTNRDGSFTITGSSAPDYSWRTTLGTRTRDNAYGWWGRDAYAQLSFHSQGWPMALEWTGRSKPSAPQDEITKYWPVHCYGMIGVGRDYSPDTGSGAELYTVIGHAPRHLDRNIALVGRIISGMEHLSSLPRGSGVLGFYTEEEAELRTPILSIRVASDLPEAEQPRFEYLTTEGETFARYAEARANRRDPFFIVPAGGADICNIPVPIRPFEYVDEE